MSEIENNSGSYQKLLEELGVSSDLELIQELKKRTGKDYNQHAIDGWKRSEPGRGVPKKVWLDLERSGNGWPPHGRSYVGNGFLLSLDELKSFPEQVQLKILDLIANMNAGPPNLVAEAPDSKRKGRP